MQVLFKTATSVCRAMAILEHMHILAIGLTCLMAASLQAQDKTPVHTVQASGQATVHVKPDHAQIRLAVSNEAATAQGAVEANSTATNAVLKTLRAAISGSAGSELKTSGYSLEPQYQYSQNAKPKLTGYRATNSITLDLNDLDQVGSAMDAAVRSGANEISGLSFSLRDEQATRQLAIGKASTVARDNAEAAAKALGLRVSGVVSVEVTGGERPNPIRPMLAQRAVADAPMTPVEAGTITVEATVTITLQVQ